MLLSSNIIGASSFLVHVSDVSAVDGISLPDFTHVSLDSPSYAILPLIAFNVNYPYEGKHAMVAGFSSICNLLVRCAPVQV